MIKIIAHRGLWFSKEEKNTLLSFERALQNNFGIETDFRDHDGRLVVSHDPADDQAVSAEKFFELCDCYPNAATHAINIKSDGLQNLLQVNLANWSPDRYFVFDMSVPDTLGYLRLGLNVFSRVSEYEPFQDFGGRAAGVWLDAFLDQWYDDKLIYQLCASKKTVAIVSPELHGRDHKPFWERLKSLYTPSMSLMLCTDFPLEAQKYFNE